MKRSQDEAWGQAEEASEYYVSITDMIIGLLFLFIILLMYFAFQMRDVSREQVIAESVRNELIRRVESRLQERGIVSRVDLVRGVLSLPNELLFETGSDTPNDAGADAMAVLAEVIDAELPCVSDRPGTARPETCADTTARLDAILIEGHTDSDPLTPTARLRDNWDLSSARASATLREMIAARPGLMDYSVQGIGSVNAKSLFSVAGYADQRPVADGDSAEAKAANRRIDLRFLMAPPKPPELRTISEGAERSGAEGPPIAQNRRVPFTIGRNVDGYLRNGWGVLEDWGVWAIGPEASLTLPIRDYRPDSAYEVTVDVVGFVPERSPERRVQVRVNGKDADLWTMTGPKNTFRHVLKLAPGAAAPDGRVRVEFAMENPLSPLEAGISEDPRRLSFGIRTITIRRSRS